MNASQWIDCQHCHRALLARDVRSCPVPGHASDCVVCKACERAAK